MHRSAILVPRTALAVFFLNALLVAVPAGAVGEMPDKQTCETAKNPIVVGGCLATDKKKGNCMACHQFNGLPGANLEGGDVGPPLVALRQRYPDKKRLHAEIFDASQFNSNTVMPPYGKHRILNEKEIELLIEWLYSL